VVCLFNCCCRCFAFDIAYRFDCGKQETQKTFRTIVKEINNFWLVQI